MAVNYEIQNKLKDGALVFDNYAYDNSIIGETFDGRAIYCFEYMVEELMTDEGCDEIEAIDWIDYNTIGSLPHGGKQAPIIVSMSY